MRLGRTSMAVLMGFIAFVTWLAVDTVQTLVFHLIDWRIPVGSGIAAAVVDLYAKDEPDEREPRP